MKFDCRRRGVDRHERLSNWHRKFALFPIEVAYGDCRWLEYVERKGTYLCGVGGCFWFWEYRAHG